MDHDEFRFADGLKQTSTSDLEFVSAMELQFMQQAEQLGSSKNDVLARATEGLSPLQNLDLHLHLFHVADTELLRTGGMEGVTVFNSTLFDRSTAVMMFECFVNLLAIAVENPHKVVWYLPMLTQSEEQRQLVEWNKISEPCPKPGWLLHEFFLNQVEADPNAIALFEYGGLNRIISYTELQSMAEKVARQMRVLGVGGDSAVGLLMTNDSAEAIASIYGMYELLKLAFQSSRPLTERHSPLSLRCPHYGWSICTD